MIGDKQRRQLVLMHEGQLLSHAGQHGIEDSAVLARCVIDGAFNALRTLEDRQEAAKYAFAVADRLVGALDAPTAWPPAGMETPAPQPPAPLKQKSKGQASLWLVCFAAFVCCLPR